VWNFFRFKDNEKNKNTKKNIKEKVEEEEEEDHVNSINYTNEYNKNIFSIVDFPERITQINKAHPLLKEKEKIVLNQILESLKKGRQKDSKQYFNELSKIRKDLSTLETSKKVMEQTSIKLSLIHDISDTLDVLGPVLKEEKEKKGKENMSNGEKTENKDREGMNTFVKTMTEDILKNNYKEIDIQSIDEIDKVFEKIMTEKER
jgi:division protein CdvB (Snf7/Vps24/ESCRT-III family)